MKIYKISVLILFFLLVQNQQFILAQNFTKYGNVISIIDGDTFDVLFENNQKIRIRMDGIDAPEKGMPYYKVAKSYLGKLCFRKRVKIVVSKNDIHGRKVAKSYLEDNRELGAEMVKAGLAWRYNKYSSDKNLKSYEANAKKLKIGLWADPHPYPPWEIRKLHRSGVSTKGFF